MARNKKAAKARPTDAAALLQNPESPKSLQDRSPVNPVMFSSLLLTITPFAPSVIFEGFFPL
jgi:hypothetical protein